MGQVVETDGTPIPLVTVVLRGPAPVTTARRVVADERARFAFERLVPGTYRLAVELPGLEAPGDVEVVARAGERIEANAVLSLFAYEVTVEVLARVRMDREITDAEDTAPTFTVPDELLESLPLPAEQALEALPLLPGVVQGPSGLVSIGGSLPTDSAFLFNGVDLIDPYSGVYRMRIPLEAVDSVKLYRGSYAATYGDSLGGVVDVSTNGARDEWSTEIASVIPRPWFRDGGLRGVRRFNPRLRFGGPMVPGRLYLSQSLGYHLDRERVEDVPDEQGDHVKIEGLEALTQLDWRPPGRHRISLFFLGFPQSEANVGLSGLTPLEATSRIDRQAEAFMLEHRYTVDPSSYLTTALQVNRVALEVRPDSPLPGGSLQVFPDGQRGTAFHREDRSTSHWQLRTSYTRFFGADRATHLLEVGAEAHSLSNHGQVDDLPVHVLGADGRLLREIRFFGPGVMDGGKREVALFVQDRYRPSERFWVDLGLRASFDQSATRVRLSPRLGVAWDVLGDRRTLAKVTAGLMHRRILLGEDLWESLQTRAEIDYQDDGSATVQVFRPTRPRELPSPRALVLGLELSHRVSPAFTLHGRLTRTESRRRPIFETIPGASLTAAPGVDPDDLVSTLLQTGEGELRLSPIGESSYNEVALSAVWRTGSGSQLFLSYVRSRVVGDLNDFGRLAGEQPDPVVRANTRARLPFDAPHRLILWGQIFLPWDLVAGTVLEWRDGFPYSVLDERQEYLGPAMTERFPSYLSADVNLTKGFRLGGRDLRGGVQVRNLTGHSNPRDVIASAASPRFGEFLNDFGTRIRIRFSAAF